LPSSADPLGSACPRSRRYKRAPRSASIFTWLNGARSASNLIALVRSPALGSLALAWPTRPLAMRQEK
jgi:hypothetical protein